MCYYIKQNSSVAFDRMPASLQTCKAKSKVCFNTYTLCKSSWDKCEIGSLGGYNGNFLKFGPVSATALCVVVASRRSAAVVTVAW
jgi:hypothetical protein